MKKQDFLKKIKEMKKEHNKELEKECLRLFNSGGVNTSDFENDCLLPKIIIFVALKNEAEQYRPFGAERKKIARNLQKF